MARTKGGPRARARHKKVIKAAKGYYGRKKNTFRAANQTVEKARQYAYRDRKVRKRDFRSLWIQRINAAARLNGMTYGTFIHGLSLTGIELDRKALSEIAIADPAGFEAIAKQAQEALAKKAA
jgi:large subunit ribosomal protein L20